MSDVIKLSEVKTAFTPKKNPSKGDYAALKTALAKFFDKVKDVSLVFGNERAEGQSDGTQDNLQLSAIVKEMNRYDVYRTPSAKVVDKIVELMTSDVNTGKYDLSEVRMALISKDVDVLKLMKQLDDKKIDLTTVANEDFIGEVCSAAGITNTDDLTKVSVEQKTKKLQEKTDLENKKIAVINDLNEALKPDSKDIGKIRTAYQAVLELKLTEKECPSLADAKKIVDEADYQDKVKKLETPDVGTDKKAKEINSVKNGIIKLMNDNSAKFSLSSDNIEKAKDAINTLSNNKSFRKEFLKMNTDKEKVSLLAKNNFPVLSADVEVKKDENIKTDNVQPNISGTENIQKNDTQDKGTGDDMALAKTFIGLWVKDANVTQIWEDKGISSIEAKALGISDGLFNLIDKKMNTKGTSDGKINAEEIKAFNETIQKYMQVFGFKDEQDAINLYNGALGFEMVDLDTAIKTGDKYANGEIGSHKITAETKFTDMQDYLNPEVYTALTHKFSGKETVTNVSDVGRFLATLPLMSRLGTTVLKDKFNITDSLPKFDAEITEDKILKYITKEVKDKEKTDEGNGKVDKNSEAEAQKLESGANPNPKEIIKIREKIKDKEPTNTNNLKQLGNWYTQLHDYAKAVENYLIACNNQGTDSLDLLPQAIELWLGQGLPADISGLNDKTPYSSADEVKTKCITYLKTLPAAETTTKLIEKLEGSLKKGKTKTTEIKQTGGQGTNTVQNKTSKTNKLSGLIKKKGTSSK